MRLTAKNGKVKNEAIHRLVALAFIPNPSGLPEVNHKDENKQNNCINNLEWCDTAYNINYSHSKKVYCIELNKIFDSLCKAAEEVGVTASQISKACQGKLKTTGGYHWEYYNGTDKP